MSKTLAEIRADLLRDPHVRAEYEALEPQFRIAQQIIDARRRAGLTQAQLAELIDTSQSSVARLEAGRQLPSTRTLLRIAHATKSEAVFELRPATA
ncbi:MAG: XRE family transcriptional regulator [Geminicoccaceae bacterium]|nr:MAG: XRE family transcriptional regulator [Geminicoccaceae bacterium]